MTNFLYSNDEQGQYPNSYYAASAHNLPNFPTQHGDESADVVIIGAGYTGLSAALHLRQQGYQVIVLEAHKVGWGASGRNGGQLGVGFNQDQDQLEASVGQEAAHALWDLSLEAVQLCKQLIEQYQIDCDLRHGIIYADHRQRFVPHSEAYVEKLQNQYQFEQIRFLTKDEIRNLISSNAYYGGYLNLAAAHLHPLNFALGLAKAAQQAGVTIYEHSPALTYNKTQPIQIKLAQGNIQAQHLIIACNGYLDDFDAHIATRIMPINNFIVATEPFTDSEREQFIRHFYAVADSKFVVNYFRFSADNRLLFGGGENYRFQFPNDIKAFVRPNLLSIFPQLQSVSLDYGWGGTLAITPKRIPYFVQLKPNILSASGYSGHGVALAVMAGKILADVVDNTLGQFDLMRKMPNFAFPGGTILRWPLLVSAMLYYSLRDKL